MNKIVVVEKYSPGCRYWQNMVRKKKNHFPLEEIIEDYKGFEGELIEFVETNENNFETKTREYKKYLNNINKQVLFVCDYKQDNKLKNNQVKFVGYDYGICELNKDLYSSIFNEVLFGSIDELVNYNEVLNKNFLFDSPLNVENYALNHYELLLQGKDVERDEMKIYEISILVNKK